MSNLTMRDRFLKTLRNETVDHPPLIVPGPWPATRARWEREGLPAGVDLYDYFELPRHMTAHLKMAPLFDPPFEERILEETETTVVKINSMGVTERNFRDGTSMPEFLDYPVKGPESLDWLRERLDPHKPGRIAADWLEQARQARERGAISLLNGGMYFAFLNEHMGTEALMTAYFDTPDFVHAVNDMLCTLCEHELRTALDAGFRVDFIGYHEDMAYKNASMISPAMFREFMTPYYQRIARLAGPGGIDLQMMDSDGNVWELIPLWLEHGINTVCPMEVAAGMDVVALRRAFGRELRMTGGFDKRILAAGKSAILKELERLRPVIEDGGYMPTIDHGTPPDVSFQNACEYVRGLKALYGMS